MMYSVYWQVHVDWCRFSAHDIVLVDDDGVDYDVARHH